MRKLIAPVGLLIGAAVWFLLFVILGFGLGTAFIAGGSALAACVLSVPLGLLDARVTSAGVLLGIATFVILEVVLPLPLWIAVVSGLGVMGLYGLVDSAFGRGRLAAEAASAPEQRSQSAPFGTPAWRNGHDREPAGAR
jgi:hypothetical protein